MDTKQPHFRILSIDGGGVRGVIPARILHALEEISHKPISELFDLIVGTSTGGLIALGLVCPSKNKTPQYSAKDILNFYLEKSNQIFQHSFFRSIFTGGGLWAAKYDRKPLDTLLNQFFQDTLLSEALRPVTIPTYSLTKGCPNVITSWPSPEDPQDYYMRDIAGATTAAPTYFDPKVFHDKKGNLHIEADGGIFANNPETIGVTEACKFNSSLSRDTVYVLSIGTGSPKLNQDANKLTNSGVIGWVIKANLIDIMINADNDWYNDEISILYPQSNRLQVALPDRLGQMDNASQDDLQGLLNITESFLNTNLKKIENILYTLCT